MLLGHLKYLDQYLNTGKHPDYGCDALAKLYGSVCFLDPWPIQRPIVIVADAATADRIVRIDKLPKDLHAMRIDYPSEAWCN